MSSDPRWGYGPTFFRNLLDDEELTGRYDSGTLRAQDDVGRWLRSHNRHIHLRHYDEGRKGELAKPTSLNLVEIDPEDFDSHGAYLQARLSTPHEHTGGPLSAIKRNWGLDEALTLAEEKEIRSHEAFPQSKKHSEGQIIRIQVPYLMPDGSLGIEVHSTTVTRVLDRRAKESGWLTGDQILRINGRVVSNGTEYKEHADNAMEVHRITSRPILFDVWRHPQRRPKGVAGPPMPSQNQAFPPQPGPTPQGPYPRHQDPGAGFAPPYPPNGGGPQQMMPGPPPPPSHTVPNGQMFPPNAHHPPPPPHSGPPHPAYPSNMRPPPSAPPFQVSGVHAVMPPPYPPYGFVSPSVSPIASPVASYVPPIGPGGPGLVSPVASYVPMASATVPMASATLPMAMAMATVPMSAGLQANCMQTMPMAQGRIASPMASFVAPPMMGPSASFVASPVASFVAPPPPPPMVNPVAAPAPSFLVNPTPTSAPSFLASPAVGPQAASFVSTAPQGGSRPPVHQLAPTLPSGASMYVSQGA
eukprot:CAMPEP_0178413396 /NCGR_PEP_ID=MMETSP0689_2-20121128/22506_1 /TAXON_ID=160604 /ORGANISM="Amphidinium massartii, Strain CS-259" /LENGTH=526 /DNA_ID=CAMNT_0020034667 /DNA_START=29 /DNA_END=1605 /DNA_ORIENTATION=+